MLAPRNVYPVKSVGYFTGALFRVPDSVLGIRKCSMHHACYSTGVRSSFKQGSHKAPTTQRVGWNFFALNHRPCALAISCLL